MKSIPIITLSTMSTIEDVMRENEKLKQQLAKLNKPVDITLKISEKRALSLYGLQQFPVTLYKDQWKLLLDKKEAILAFIEEHDSELKEKPGRATNKNAEMDKFILSD